MIPRRPVAVVLLMLAACSPTFNWRETRLDDDRLQALLPCKPDHAKRALDLLGPGQAPAQVSMAGCAVGAVTFAVASLTLADKAQSAPAMVSWKQATLAQIRSTAAVDQAFQVKTAARTQTGDSSRSAVGTLSLARGQDTSGAPIEVQVAYFSQDQHVYQAIVLGPRIDPTAAETFFSGLKLQ